jgi:hypothetical protein
VRPDRACGPCAALFFSAELFKFSTVSMEWTTLDPATGVKGTGPSARSFHAMSAVGTDQYLFGGDCKGSNMSADLFKFSILSMEWTNLDAAAAVKGTGPSARSGHAMSAVGTNLYLFGGFRFSGKGGRWW